MKKEYTEQNVAYELNKLPEVSVNTVYKSIHVLHNPTRVGVKAWGKIDYLKKVHGYTQLFTDNLTGKRQHKPKDEESVDIKHSKRDKVNNKEMINNHRFNLKGLDSKIKQVVNKLK